MKIYVAPVVALKEKERQDETQFITVPESVPLFGSIFYTWKVGDSNSVSCAACIT